MPGCARLAPPCRSTERLDDGARPAPRRLLDPVAAWYVGNVLLGAPPPENAAGGRIAFKTGTSYGYRDAWAVGFDGKRTIGVWVGRPDGAPVPGLVGRTAAAPILFDAFAAPGQPLAPLPRAPNGAICRVERQTAAAAAALPAAAACRRGRRAGAAHHVPAERRAARACRRPAANPIRWRSRSPAASAPLTVLVNGLPLRRGAAGARCSSSRTGRASCG